jgi:signal transduction protein with GAF and PtsI domain
MLRTHGTSDLGVLALLEGSGYGSMLVTPIMHGREAVGLLQCLNRAERHWTHTEASRARIVAHQLGAVLAALTDETQPAPTEGTPVSDPGPAHVGP